MKFNNIFSCDIIVVGTGIAGLIATKKALLKGKKVCLVTNGKFCGGASYFPLKGTLGIQGTDEEKDRELFYEDISKIGNHMENPHMINTYIDEIEENISSLNEIGFEPWLRDDKRPACFAKYARNIYLIKDWEKASKKAKEIFYSLDNLQILENTSFLHIIKDDSELVGGVFKKGNDFICIKSPVIVIATGGIAGNFKHKLYPNEVNGTGHIIALEAGAKAQNMEFIQFIPAFLKPKYNTLFGEHTAKYCTGMYSLDNELILDGVNNPKYYDLWLERSGYAPFSFDFKSHLIDLKMVEQDTETKQGVILKYSDELYKDQGEFYRVYLDWLKNSMGIDMCRDQVVISPFAHSCNGGLKVSENGETGVNGLYAIGEVSSAIEGANRLGGNSVGGALVFGKRAINSAVNYLENKKLKNVSDEFLEKNFNEWLENIFADDVENSFSSEKALEILKNITTQSAGIKRDKISLENGIKALENLRKNYSIKSNFNNNSLEIYLRIEVSKMLLSCMLAREESRGAHYREDFPYTLDVPYKIIVARKENNFILEKVYVD